MKTVVTTDQGNGGAEEQALEYSAENIETVDAVLRVLQVKMPIDIQIVDAVEPSAEDAHEVGHDRQGGDQQQAGQEPRHDEIMDRIGAHARQGVDLLGHAHRAQFGRHGAAHAARQHRRRQHRSQFADQRKIDHRPQQRFHVHPAELSIGLHCQNDADEGPRQHHHPQAPNADLVKSRQERFPPHHAGRQPQERAKGKQGEAAQAHELLDEPAAKVGNRIGNGLNRAAAGRFVVANGAVLGHVRIPI